jgi:hypothetical protein
LTIDPEYCLSPERRLDLLLRSERGGWVCVIENKILSDEGEEQTTDYYTEMMRSFPPVRFPSRLFIYLTPDGALPKSRHFLPMGYSSIEVLLASGSGGASAFGQSAIDQYVRCVRRRVVEQERLQDICWRLYRNHRTAIDTIVRHGNFNLLANKSAERVLQLLRDDRRPVITGLHVEWESSKGRDWIAIWPRHWPTGPSRRYPAFYGIEFKTQGTTETVKVGIWGDTPWRAKVKDLFIKQAVLASKDGQSMLELLPFESRDLGDLQKAVEDSANALVARVQESFDLLGTALRTWDEESNRRE